VLTAHRKHGNFPPAKQIQLQQRGHGSVPIYSADEEAYRSRVHRNGRDAVPIFESDERLFRRYPKASLINGKPVPLTMLLEAEVSANRSKYSEPQDVLESDCCEGHNRAGCVVLDMHVSDIPESIPTGDGSGRIFPFRLVHEPRETCFPHSEIRCNQDGDIRTPHEEPPKSVRNLFRAEVARQLSNRAVLEFVPLSG
jgi:hypothetical protein